MKASTTSSFSRYLPSLGQALGTLWTHRPYPVDLGWVGEE